MVLKTATTILKKATKKKPPVKKEKEPLPSERSLSERYTRRKTSQLDAVNKVWSEKIKKSRELPWDKKNPFLTKQDVKKALREDRDNPEAYRYSGKLRYAPEEMKHGGMAHKKKKVVKRGTSRRS
jgi:hypothetical protein